MTFKEWMSCDDDLVLREILELEREEMMCEGPLGWAKRQLVASGRWVQGRWKKFIGWLREAWKHSRVLARALVALLRNLPQVMEVVLRLPTIIKLLNNDRQAMYLARKTSVLEALKQVGSQEMVRAEVDRLQKLVDQGEVQAARNLRSQQKMLSQIQSLGNLQVGVGEVALAEEFLRGSIGALLRGTYDLFHIPQMLNRLPDLTVRNTVQTLVAFYDSQNKKIQPINGLKAVLAALVEWVQFLATAALMTGMLAKIYAIMEQYQTALALSGGSWVLMGLLKIFHSDGEHEGKESPGFIGRCLGTLVMMLDPGAKLGLIDKVAGKTPSPEEPDYSV